MLGIEIKAKFLPRDYDIFAGLDVDKKHIDVTFMDHAHLMKSMKIPYDANHLLAYSRRHFPGQRIAFAYERGRWTTSAWTALRELDCAGAIRFKLDRLISMATFSDEQARQTAREIFRFCKTDTELSRNLELLLTIPGIGRITGTHLMA